ncbi:MAG: O-antigen ligase family protein [Pseudomonadota bacterium]
MTLADNTYATPQAQTPPNYLFWAVVDATLLSLIILLSADMLIQMRFLQSPLWLLAYGLTVLRISVVWSQFLPVLMRNWVILIYPAICIASVSWSLTKPYSLVASLQLTMTMVMGMYLGWRYSMTVILKALAVVLSIGVALSILHWATGVFPWPVYTRIGGLAGLFSSKNMLGLRALFAGIAIVSILLMHRHEASQLFRQLAIFALLGNMFAMMLSLSMTSVLLMPVMAGALLALCWHRIPPAVFVAGLFGTLAAVSFGPVILAIAGINPIEVILGAVGKSTTLTGRVYLWQIAYEVYQENPIAGVGYRAFWQAPQFLNERLATQDAGATTSRSFHNFPLEILVSAGWAALLAMFAIIWVATARMLTVYRRTRSVAMAGGLALMVGVIVSSLTGTTLYRGHEIMIILLVAFAVTAGEDLHRMRNAQNARPKGTT